MFGYGHENDSKIVGINLKKDGKGIVEIALKTGQFIFLDLNNNASVDESFLALPSHSVIGMTGFYL